MIDLAADLARVVGGSVFTPAAGTLRNQDETAARAFASGGLTPPVRSYGGGSLRDAEESQLLLTAADLSGDAPQVDAVVVVTGDTDQWLVNKVSRLALPGGSARGWILSIQRDVERTS